MKIQGTLEHSDLEGGTWVFQSNDGNRYQLAGLPSELEVSGNRLELEGQVDTGAFTIGMMGAVFQVTRARKL